MSKKRRMFDIDIDLEAEAPAPAAAVPAGTEPEAPVRRGPMATAITENAEAVTQRQQLEAAIRAENDALAHELVRLRKEGLITQLVPLAEIRSDKLLRDRRPGRDEEIDELKASIKAVGLSNPIRVEPQGDHYELIQGHRRLTAYRELYDETKNPSYAAIPAVITARGEAHLKLYRQMVDENLVRRGVSFAELAALAIGYRKAEPSVEGYDEAVERLFASAGRQKRVYIRGFVRLLVLTGDALKHPEALPRALGLDLLKRLEGDKATVGRLVKELAEHPVANAEDELARLRAFLTERPVPLPKGSVQKTARTTFRLTRPEGAAKCTAADGRLELRQDRDFSGIERQKLERAVRAFFDALDD